MISLQLGVSIDIDLNFNVHVKKTVRKVSRKLQVLKHYKHLIPTHNKKRLYLAYFLPHLTYCSVFVWFHCGKRNADIIEKLIESILRFVFNDIYNPFEKLLQEVISLRARQINDVLILVFLALNNAAPSYISDLFTERQSSISLRGKRRLVTTCKYNKLWFSLISISCQQTMKLTNYGIALKKTVQLDI